MQKLKMGFRMAPSLFALVFVSSLTSPTSMVFALYANVSQGVVYTNYGDDAEIFCFIPEEAVRALPPDGDRLCRYYRVDDKDGARTVILNATDSYISDQIGPGKYDYVGTGVREGQCGLKIYAVTDEQVGKWTCIFIAGQIWQASIEVLKYEKPSRPSIVVDETLTEINVTDWQSQEVIQNSTEILCCSAGGRPIADTKLALYLNDEEVPDIVLKKVDSSLTCIQWEKVFTKEHNDQKLICRVSHPAVKDEEIQQVLVVNVEYSPEIVYVNGEKGEFITKRVYNKSANEVDLYLTVKGNPIPNVEMKRNVTRGSGDSELVEIHIKNVEIHSERNSNDFILTIDAPSEDEIECQITAENYLGKDFGTTIVTPPPDDNGATFWIMIAVGIVMSLIFIAIIFLVVNNAAKNRGWFGYEARKEKYRIKATGNTTTTPIREHEYSSVARMDESRF